MGLDDLKKMHGFWRLKRVENCDDCLKQIGAPYLFRKIFPYIRQEQRLYFIEEKNEVVIQTSFAMQQLFPIEEYKLDKTLNQEISGEQVEIKAELEDSKLKITQKPTNPNATAKTRIMTREITTDENGKEELLITLQVGDAICKRYFQKLLT